MDRNQLALAIRRTAYLEGSFKLRSGQQSSRYLDKYMLESDPVLLAELAARLAAFVPNNTQVLAGLELGGVPLAAALSLQTGIPVVFVRKAAKAYGTAKLAEGVEIAGKRVCIVEDVVTTGGQVLASANELRTVGAQVETVLCIIERDLQGRSNLAREDLQLYALYRLDEIVSAGEKGGQPL